MEWSSVGLRGIMVFVVLGIWGGMIAAQRPEPGDKSEGEEELILEREQWFSESRGLGDLNRPDRLRRAALEATRAMRDVERLRDSRAAWTEMGPSPMNMFQWAMGRVAGRIAALAVHPDDDQIIYLGAASGGLWKTTDGGGQWTSIFDDIGTLTIGCVVLDPQDPQTVWVGTGEQRQSCTSYFGLGLFKSGDAGASFVEMNGSGSSTLDLSYVAAVAIHPTNDQIVLAGGHGWCNQGVYEYGGLFRSTDRGQTWTKVLTGSVNDIIADPAHPGTFYVASGRWGLSTDGIYKSTDGFATWNRLENGIAYGSQIGRCRLTQSPSNSLVLYALMNMSGSGTRIYKTADGGASWTLQNTSACEGQCDYNLCIDVHPTNPNTLLVGSIRFARSTNSGQSLTYLTSGWGSSQTVHQDTHVLLYDRTDGNRFWVAGDGGLWRTDNDAASFHNLNANLNITQFYDIAVKPGDHKTIFGGSQDNSSEATFGTTVWDVTVVTGDGFMNLVDPLNPAIVYQTSYPSGLPNVVRSTSGGAPGTFSWLPMTGCGTGEPYPWVTPLAIVANAAGTQSYQFVGSNRVYLSQDDGWTWTPLSASALSSYALSVIEPYVSGTTIGVFAGSSDGRIFHCDDVLSASPAWQEVTDNYPGGRVSDIAVDPNDAKNVFVTRGAFGAGRLYQSQIGGGSWNAIGSGLPDVPANTVAIDPAYPNRIFVGTDTGVFESTDSGKNFSTMMIGFPLGAVVNDLEIDAASRTLTAGTYGRGAWQTSLVFEALSVDCGLDRFACVDEPLALLAVQSNGLAPITWAWSVVQEPPGAVYTFTGTSSDAPTLTAQTAGDYRLLVQVTDGLSRLASDELLVTIGDDAATTAEMIARWSTHVGDPGWQPNLDRIADGSLNLRDLVLQITDPQCL